MATDDAHSDRSSPAAEKGQIAERHSTTEGNVSGETSHPTMEQKLSPAGAAADPNLVGWDGPDDPANPRNWTKRRKMLNVALLSLSVLYSYVCNAPGILFVRPGIYKAGGCGC